MWFNHYEIDQLVENFGNSIILQGYLCAVDSVLKRNNILVGQGNVSRKYHP